MGVTASGRFFHRRDDVDHRLFAVVEEHQAVVGGEQRVGDAGETRG